MNINIQLAAAAASEEEVGFWGPDDEELILEVPEMPHAAAAAAAAEAEDLLPILPIRGPEHAAKILTTLYTIGRDVLVLGNMKREHTSYTIRPEYFVSSASPLAAQASVLRARAGIADITMLLTVAYQREVQVAGNLGITSCRVSLIDTEGQGMAKQLYIPIDLISTGVTPERDGPKIPFPRIYQQLGAQALIALAEECIRSQMDVPYAAEAFLGGTPDRIMPDGFVFVSRSEVEAGPHAQPPLEVAMGLSEAAKEKIAGTTQIGCLTVENLDRKLEGHCLFETIGTLTGRSPRMLREACGNPAPGTVVPGAYISKLEEITGCEFLLFRACTAAPGYKQIPRQEPARKGRQKFRLLLAGFSSKPGVGVVDYLHVYHMTTERYDPRKAVEERTTFIAFDIETVYDQTCVNRAWALNLLAYQPPRVLPSFILSNSRTLELQTRAVNPDTGEEVPIFTGSALNREAEACARIFFHKADAPLDSVMANLWGFIRQLHAVTGNRAAWNYVLVGFNSACFDNFVLARALTTAGLSLSTLDVGIFGNRILTLNFRIGTDIAVSSWDVRRHVVGSLDSCCKAWGIPAGAAKGHLEHCIVQSLYDLNPAKFYEAIEVNRADQTFANQTGIVTPYFGIERYCRQDALATAALHIIYRYAIQGMMDTGTLAGYGASFTMLAHLAQGEKTPERIAKKLVAFAPLPMRPVAAQGEEDEDTQFLRKIFDLIPEAKFIPDRSGTIQQAAAAIGIQHIRRFSLKSMAIETYDTLAQYANKVGNAMSKLENLENVGGFDYSSSIVLREQVCVAGRSQANIGIWEDEPLAIVDAVSLYPTVMSAPGCTYALAGAPVHVSGEEYDKYAPAPGIWQVQLIEQPNGVVIPARSRSGYWWNKDEAKDTVQLKLTPDIESLKLVGAKFKIIDGLVFPNHSEALYHSYVQVARDEKTHQDALKSGRAVPRWEGEIYSPGRREVAKAVLNIRSGKEITKIRKAVIKLGETESFERATDRANQQEQLLIAEQSRRVYEDPCLNPAEKLAASREAALRASRIHRLSEDPAVLSEKLVMSKWSHQPEKATTSQLNGCLIYAYSRLFMNRVYRTIGFENILATETDSILLPARLLPKLYELRSPWGSPMLYAESESRLGLLVGAPTCARAKEFGQLEIETTEKLVEYSAKRLELYERGADGKLKLDADGKPRLDVAQLRTLEYYHPTPEEAAADPKAGQELVGNGRRTGLRGPYACVAAKKVYVIYLLAGTQRVCIKYRFKGVSFGRDAVQEEDTPDIAPKPLDPREDIRYITLVVPCAKPAGWHLARPEDIFTLYERKNMRIWQNQVARADTLHFTTVNAAVRKRLVEPLSTPAEKDRQDIAKASRRARETSLIAMAGRIAKTTELLCEICGKLATRTAGRLLACEEHGTREDTGGCRYKNAQGRPVCRLPAVRQEEFCPLHLHKLIQSDGELVQCSKVGCKNSAASQPIASGQFLCDEHINELFDGGLPTCEQERKRKRKGSRFCGAVVHRAAVEQGLCLCRLHFYHAKSMGCAVTKMSEEKKQIALSKLERLERAAEPYQALPMAARLAICMHPITHGRRGRGLCGAPALEGTRFCKSHSRQAERKPAQGIAQLGMESTQKIIESKPEAGAAEAGKEVAASIGERLGGPAAAAGRPASGPIESLLAARSRGRTCTMIVRWDTDKGIQQGACGKECGWNVENGEPRCFQHISKPRSCAAILQPTGGPEKCGRPAPEPVDGHEPRCSIHPISKKECASKDSSTSKPSGSGCAYIISRGAHKGQPCGKPSARGTGDAQRCSKHKN